MIGMKGSFTLNHLEGWCRDCERGPKNQISGAVLLVECAPCVPCAISQAVPDTSQSGFWPMD